MSHDLHSGPALRPEYDAERFATFTDQTIAVVSNPSPSHLNDFASLIENVIVPRLLMTHAENEKPPEQNLISNQAVADFITLTTGDSPEGAVEFVRDLLNKGVPFQKILLDLMAPAARELGARWVHDSTSFVEVTLGVGRMHRILRDFDGIPAHMWSNDGEGKHVLLLPVPGEQHTFGLRLVQEFLLRESWTVTNHPVEHLSELDELVANTYFDVVGLSSNSETLIGNLHSAIARIRSKSRNRHVRIIVGGHIFTEYPELIKSCGADAFGADAPASVAILNGWARELAAVN